MSIVAEKLAEALALPREDRAFLARELIVSLDDGMDPDVESEWHDVIERRSREMDAGKVSGRSMESVLTEIRAKLNATPQAS